MKKIYFPYEARPAKGMHPALFVSLFYAGFFLIVFLSNYYG